MNRDVFDMQMNSLATYLNIAVAKEVLNTEYFPRYQNFPDKRFAEIVQWLKENFNPGYMRFPLLSDFSEAERATRIISTYKEPDKREKIEREEYSNDLLALAKRFRKPEPIGEKPLPKQAALYRRMKEENKIYSIKLGKWIDRLIQNNVGGGQFVFPEDRIRELTERIGL